MMVYIAAARPLEMVPWDEQRPGFHVKDLHESELAVREQFEGPHVYYAGSYEGCGCGFQYGEYPEYEGEDRPAMKATLIAFAEYLSTQLTRIDFLELYACWDGDQAAPPEHRRSLTPDSLRDDTFYFLQKERSRIANR